MKVKEIRVGDIIAWVAAFVLFFLNVIDIQILILFVLLKIKFTLYSSK